MLDQINWEMLIAFTVLLTFHGSIFLKLAKNIFITKPEHELFSKKIDARLYGKNGIPIYVSQANCDRRSNDYDRRSQLVSKATCKKIDELKAEIKGLQDIITGLQMQHHATP